MAYLELALETKYIFIALSMWGCSSVVEHSTADREAGSSIPLTPFSIITNNGLPFERLLMF